MGGGISLPRTREHMSCELCMHTQHVLTAGLRLFLPPKCQIQSNTTIFLPICWLYFFFQVLFHSIALGMVRTVSWCKVDFWYYFSPWFFARRVWPQVGSASLCRSARHGQQYIYILLCVCTSINPSKLFVELSKLSTKYIELETRSLNLLKQSTGFTRRYRRRMECQPRQHDEYLLRCPTLQCPMRSFLLYCFCGLLACVWVGGARLGEGGDQAEATSWWTDRNHIRLSWVIVRSPWAGGPW